MPKLRQAVIVEHSASDMFQLVNDIESYPHFLPMCNHAVVHHRSDEQVTATLHMKKGLLQKSFTTCNRLTPHDEITLQLVDGPFKDLSGKWLFQELPDGKCKVELVMDYEFSNSVISSMIGPIFTAFADTLVEAFSKRAVEVAKKNSRPRLVM